MGTVGFDKKHRAVFFFLSFYLISKLACGCVTKITNSGQAG